MYPVRTCLLQNELVRQKQVTLSVLRFDEVHPVISGNKLFKLHDFFEDMAGTGMSHVVTFGGAYSNHLVATAYACREKSISCTGIVRGEQPAALSHTLQHCLEFGMQLKFVSRSQYRLQHEPGFLKAVAGIDKPCYCIPEGGYHPLGAAGAAMMMNQVEPSATHIACAVGTATTVAGLLSKADHNQQVIAVPVLKGMTDLQERIEYLTGKRYDSHQFYMADGYHFDGYAKSNAALFDFMNGLYQEFELPTDFVYTAKLMYGIFDLIRQDFFKPGSNIVCLHTGGLQGNLSLQKGVLTFT